MRIRIANLSVTLDDELLLKSNQTADAINVIANQTLSPRSNRKDFFGR